jgi:hypothetical protein
MTARRILPMAAVPVGLVAGCSSSDATLESRPTDADGAQDLTELVADTAHCGSSEYVDDRPDECVR